MENWIQQMVNSDQAGFSVLAAVFLLGFISVFSCACNFTIIGIIAGYTGTIGAKGRVGSVLFNSLFFLIGTIVSMSVLGGLIGFASELISNSFGSYWKIAAGLVAIFFGLLSLNLLPFKMPGFTFKSENKKSGVVSSFILGLTIGGLTLAFSTCCNPVFPIVVAISFVKGSFIWGILLLMVYAIGYGLSLTAIVAGLGLGLGKTSKTFASFGVVLNYAGGIAMILTGFYLLITF